MFLYFIKVKQKKINAPIGSDNRTIHTHWIYMYNRQLGGISINK